MKRQPGEHGLGYGPIADLYDRIRPSYPRQVIADTIELAKPSWMIDAGSGTGKAAVLFAEAGIPGVAIEGDPAMAEVARRRLEDHPSWRVDVSRFEDWRPAPGDPPVVNLMACAQAFHWFDAATRFSKAHSLIREGGWLALIYNGPAPFDSPTRQAINAAYEKVAPEFERRGVAGGPGAVDDERLKHPLFPKLVRKTYQWSKTYTGEEWTSLMRTQSDHIALPPDRREALMEAITTAIEDNGNAYEHPYLCHLFALQRA